MPKFDIIKRESFLFRNIFWSFVINAGGAVLVFLMQALLSSKLGTREYGYFSLVISWCSILVFFSGLGMDSTLLRFIPAYLVEGRWDAVKGVLKFGENVVLISSFGVALTFSGVVFLMRNQLPESLFPALLLGSLLIPLWALSMQGQVALRALQKVVFARSPEIVIRPLLVLVVVGTLALTEKNRSFSAADAVFIYFLATVVSFSLLISFFQIFYREKIKNSNTTSFQKIWIKTSLPMSLISGMVVVLNEIDKVMLGYFVSGEELGLYSAAFRINMFVLFAVQTTDIITAPLIAKKYAAKDFFGLQNMVSITSLLVGVTSVFIVMVVVGFSSLFFSLFGVDEPEAQQVLITLVIGQFIVLFWGPSTFILIMTDFQFEYVKILCITFVCNVVINIPTIVLWGIKGAAFSTAFAIVLRGVLSWQRSRRITEIDSSIFFAVKYFWKRSFLLK